MGNPSSTQPGRYSASGKAAPSQPQFSMPDMPDFRFSSGTNVNARTGQQTTWGIPNPNQNNGAALSDLGHMFTDNNINATTGQRVMPFGLTPFGQMSPQYQQTMAAAIRAWKAQQNG